MNPIPLSRFDQNPYLINCQNGTFDLKNMCFREHDWADYLTMQTNFEYTMQDVSFPRWEQFVEEVLEGDTAKARYLQKAFGYSMVGVANEECMFILHGKTTRNGKSTMLNAIHHLLGDYAAVAPAALICRAGTNKNADAANPMLASLKGKRFVTMAENKQDERIDEDTVKQLTGGEEVRARNLYEDPISFLPQFTLWLSCNDLPAITDRSVFMSERVRVVEFNRHFTAAERDKSLKTLFHTPEAMKGIFAWLVEGYALYRREGLVMPSDMEVVIEQYERDNDLVLQFLEDKCKQDADAVIPQKTLYDLYKIWCRSNGLFVFSAKKFSAELDAHPEWQSGSQKELRDVPERYSDQRGVEHGEEKNQFTESD